MKFSTFLFLLSLAFLSACGLGDDFAEVPMFIEVSSLDLVTTGEQGAATHEIRDVWVTIDGFSRGVFEVAADKPARIPVLSDDETVSLQFFPGIRKNGITLSPFLYPFIERKSFELEYKPGETIPLDLVFEYKETAQFPVLDGFEGPTLFTEDLDDHESVLQVCNDPDLVEYGQGCGKFIVTDENVLFRQATGEIFSTADFNASNVYLEIDFKAQIPFSIGYVAYQNNVKQTITVGGGGATNEWRKLYLDLSADLNGGNVDQYQLFIGGGALLPSGVDEATILIDNVKLVYLEN